MTKIRKKFWNFSIELQNKLRDYWMHRRLQYGLLRDLVTTVDRHVTGCTLISFTFDLLFICRQIFRAFRCTQFRLIPWKFTLKIYFDLHHFISATGQCQHTFEWSIFGFQSFYWYFALCLCHFRRLTSMTDRLKWLNFCTLCLRIYGAQKQNAFWTKWIEVRSLCREWISSISPEN